MPKNEFPKRKKAIKCGVNRGLAVNGNQSTKLFGMQISIIITYVSAGVNGFEFTLQRASSLCRRQAKARTQNLRDLFDGIVGRNLVRPQIIADNYTGAAVPAKDRIVVAAGTQCFGFFEIVHCLLE